MLWGRFPSLAVCERAAWGLRLRTVAGGGSVEISCHRLALPKPCQGSGRCCLAEHTPERVPEMSSPTPEANFKSS